jgi:hypothetical protein
MAQSRRSNADPRPCQYLQWPPFHSLKSYLSLSKPIFQIKIQSYGVVMCCSLAASSSNLPHYPVQTHSTTCLVSDRLFRTIFNAHKNDLSNFPVSNNSAQQLFCFLSLFRGNSSASFFSAISVSPSAARGLLGRERPVQTRKTNQQKAESFQRYSVTARPPARRWGGQSLPRRCCSIISHGDSLRLHPP